MGRRRWYEDRPPVSFEIDTGSGTHRLTWTRGSLVLHDHDVAAERVLQALGGEPCLCLAVLDACRQLNLDLTGRRSGLAAYSTVPSWLQRGPVFMRRTLAELRQTPHFAAMPPPRQEQVAAQVRRRYLSRAIPDRMRDVLAAAWEVQRERRFRRPRPPGPPVAAETRLQAAAAPACEAAMRQARRDLRPYATFTIECWRRQPGERPLLNGSLHGAGGALALSLPVSWLNRVWSRGLAVVDGHFVLEVDGAAPASHLEGWAIRWERRLAGRSSPAAVPCSLRRGGDGHWTLAW
jgi:hypothetical protein